MIAGLSLILDLWTQPLDPGLTGYLLFLFFSCFFLVFSVFFLFFSSGAFWCFCLFVSRAKD